MKGEKMNEKLLDFALWLEDNEYLNKEIKPITRFDVLAKPQTAECVLALYTKSKIEKIKDERRIN
jgi:hypothetical protein